MLRDDSGLSIDAQGGDVAPADTQNTTSTETDATADATPVATGHAAPAEPRIAEARIAALRAEFDRVDAEILGAASRRRALSRAIAAVKAEAGRAVRDPAREDEVRAAWTSAAARLDVPVALALALLDVLQEDSIALQRSSVAPDADEPGDGP